MQRKAIPISGSGVVISCARFQNGGSNGLEGSKDCRSVGGHGNQHVRLRSAQVSLSGVTCPVQEAIFAFELAGARGAQYASGKILGLLEEVLDGVFHASRR